MRYFTWIITLPLAVFAVSFALSNRDRIDLRLEPLPYAMTMPICALGFGAFLIGFIVAACMSWVSLLRHRYRARSLARKVATLEGELAALRQPKTISVIA